MHHHSEHRWSLVPLRGKTVPIKGWRAHREPTTIAQARQWLANGWRLGVLLEGLTAVRPLDPAAEELADSILPKTVARWGSTRLYSARAGPIPSLGLVDVRSSGVLPLPDARVWAPANAPDLHRQLHHLQALAIIAQHPEHSDLAWRAVATHWPEHEIAHLAGGPIAVPPGDDPWRELRMQIGDDAGRLRSVVFFEGLATVDSVSRLTKMLDAFRAVMRHLGCRDLYVRGILSDYEQTPCVLALRASIRELAGVDPDFPMDGRFVAGTFRSAAKPHLYPSRRCSAIIRWGVRPGAPKGVYGRTPP